jgi:hypothetical protein
MDKDNPYALPDWDWEKPDLSGWAKQRRSEPPFTHNWEHGEDYNIEGAEWVSFDTIGAPYQVQMDVHTGKFRHRSRNEMGPWRSGHPTIEGPWHGEQPTEES